MTALRPELPPMPERCKKLPLSPRGYPVPWFVAWIDGVPDFRILKPDAIPDAHHGGRCWICGGTLGRYRAFVVGPMCVVNRVSAEPPSHVDCADWAARACPFLARPHARRREAGMPEERVEAAGTMLKRNPGVAVVWVTTFYTAFRVPDDGHGNPGVLFDIGQPHEIRYYAEGRDATRAEVEASIDSGLPKLREVCDSPQAHAALDRQVAQVAALLPA